MNDYNETLSANGAANIVAVETATDACSVAVLSAQGCFYRHQIAPRKHTELLLDMLDAVLAEAALALTDMDAVAFGQGPGSFSGVRVAAAVCQGIATAQQLPVIAVSSLHALGYTAGAEDKRHVLVLNDARRGEVYCGAYRFDTAAGGGEIICHDHLCAPEAVALAGDTDWLAAGNAWDSYAERLPAHLCQLERSECEYPSATAIARIAACQFAHGNSQPAAAALPIYLRGAVS